MTIADVPRPDGLISGNWKTALGLVAFLGWLVLLAVSLSANGTFAYSIGTARWERVVLAGGAVASDMLKALCPLAFLYCLAQRRWWPAITAAAVGVVTLIFSIFSSVGFVSGERWGKFDAGAAEIRQAHEARDAANQIEAQAVWLPGEKLPISVIEAQISAKTADRAFAVTKGCSLIPAGPIEQWCREFRQLGVDLSAAKARELAEFRASVARTIASKIVRQEADYQVAAIVRATGAYPHVVLLGLVGLTVALIEIGSCFGLTLALGLLKPDSAPFRAFQKIEPAAIATPETPQGATAKITGQKVAEPVLSFSEATAQEVGGTILGTISLTGRRRSRMTDTQS